MKIISLIKATMTDNMNLFRIRNKDKNKSSNKIMVAFLVIFFFFYIWSFANMLIEPLIEVKMEYVLLTLFVIITTIVTFVEGIYKSGSLLFNCKDDDLLLSLPIKKSTVLFIRVFKFYIFELLYNSLFLVPAIVVYATKVQVDWTFYLSSVFAVLLLPIIPIVISCIIGGVISHTSSKFKFKNFTQIALTMIFLVFVFYLSFNLEGMISKLGENATNINDTITKIYYPAGAYVKLATIFNILDLLLFVFIHLAIFAISIVIFSNIYFKINSRIKVVKKDRAKSEYTIKVNRSMVSLIKKEFKKFLSTPVFVINSAFGLVLFVVACVIIALKFDGIPSILAENEIDVTVEKIKTYIPVLIFALICFASLMSSITSSMISLEGKAFNVLKSLPVKPFTIIISKVITAILIMLPFILIGDLILIVKFGLSIIQILIILVASIVIPMVSETFGIIVNIKHPKMDAENDAEVVKQSASTMIAVIVGMLSTGLTIGVLGAFLALNMNSDLVILCGLVFYIFILMGLLLYLNKKSVKEFNRINV